MDASGNVTEAPKGKALAGMALGALGVVYGDIGTSPLYALKECFVGPHGVPVTHEDILGVLSLIFWSLNFVVTFKYLSIVMRADNRGEGGIMALLALVRPAGEPSRHYRLLIAAGLFGAALLYGDGIITPAISVLGAVDGLSVATPRLQPLLVPIAIVIISGLFAFQRRGTAGVGKVFGPLTLVWFICIAILGIRGIARNPSVLAALNPWHAVVFFADRRGDALEVLAAVVLVVTGGEALYADMGHFGRRPIRIAWYGLVLPALVLNYFGQGAMVLHDPAAASNPFYSLVPPSLLYPMVGVATAAAVVASQALISGAFSLTRQAVQLGFSPRVNIVHTSRTEIGQIYIPQVNALLWIACVGLVLAFRTPSALAATYGVAVTGTMAITSVLFIVVARSLWRWSWLRTGLLAGVFLIVDLAFFGANLLKIPDGGWVPLTIAAIVYIMMSTWKKGRIRLGEIVRETALPLADLVAQVRPLPRVSGTAIFMTSVGDVTPPVLLHHLKHNKVLHEKVLILSIVTEEVPQVPVEDRFTCEELGLGIYKVRAHFGFMETPDVPEMLRTAVARGEKALAVKPMDTTYYLGRETLIASARPVPGAREKLAGWRKKIFIVMTRNAQSAMAFYGLPPNRVVELGAQIQF
jgi:KUP system potassium uptake protein